MQQGRSDRQWQHDEDSRQGSGSGSSSRPRQSSGTMPRIERNRSPSSQSHQKESSNRKPSIELKLERNRVDNTDEAEFHRIQSKAQLHAQKKDRQRKKSREHASTDEEDAFERFQTRKGESSVKENGSHPKEKEPRKLKKPASWSDESEAEGHHTSNGRVNGHHHSRSSRDRDRRDSRGHDRGDDYYYRRDERGRDHDERRDRRGREYEDWREDGRRREDERREADRRKDDRRRDSGRRDEERRREDREDRGYMQSDHSRSYESDRDRRPRYNDDRERGSHSRRDGYKEHREDDRHYHHHSHSSTYHKSSRHEVNGERNSSEARIKESSLPREESQRGLPSKLVPIVVAPDPLPAPAPAPIPITPSPPLPPPIELSFKPVKLPHELLQPANTALIPTRKSDGKKLMPYIITYDPELHQSKEEDSAIKKGIVKKTEFDGTAADPRKQGKQRAVRSQFRVPVYKWDKHSTKAKPPGPPCAVLVTGASPVMIVSKIRFHFQSFGKVADVESRIDQLGQSLGIFYVRFHQDYDENLKLKPDAKEGSAQRGDLVARDAVKSNFISGESVKVSLDDEDKTQFKKVYAEEMARRTAPKAKAVPVPLAIPSASLSGSPMPPPEAPTNSRIASSTLASTTALSVASTPPMAVPPIATASTVAPRFKMHTWAGQNPVVQSNNRVAGTRSHENWSNAALPAHLQHAARRPVKTSWADQELFSDAKLLILRELGETFMRDLKTRTIAPFLKEFLRPDKAGGQALRPPPTVVEEEEESESEVEIKSTKGRRRRVVEEERHRVGVTPESTEMSEKSPSDEEGDAIVAESAADGEGVRRESKKGGKATKKKSKSDFEELAAEEGTAVAVPTIRTKAKKAAVKKGKEQAPALDPVNLGLAEDEEDLYYLKVALEKVKSGKSLADVQAEELEAIEIAEQLESGEGVNGLPRHASGSARTEGIYRIPPAEKAVHMPDRNRAVVDPSSVVGFASARGNRADSRRFVQGIEQHKKETATDTDILKFNQLRSRKKQLKFSKSPIHDWGLYAVELIPAGDMVIEYVGEIVRQQVADQREKMYERQGNFSTYLFRVDDDVVVDATKKGNIARLMNHCCTPNCNAKILTLNGEKRIVLFAQKPILPGQELTYDYKFQATGDEEDAIACLCGSPGCRRFL